MSPRLREPVVFALLALSALLAFAADCGAGPAALSWNDIRHVFSPVVTAGAGTGAEILRDFRLPRAVAALCAGAGLGLAGFLLQTQFRNPLAGPAELGISSGAGLGVAVLLLVEPLLPAAWVAALGAWPLAAAAAVGACATLLLLLPLAARLWDAASLLLAGLMLASACGALVSLLQYFSAAAPLKTYVLWGMGGLGGVTWPQNGVLALCTAAGTLAALLLSRPLYAFLLGENAAAALGISVRRFRLAVLLVAGLLSGAVTAFCGPIAFVGLAVPHLARGVLRRSDPKAVQPACALLGATLLLVCDAISHFPGQDAVLPINAITALFGAPTVLVILLRRPRSAGSGA